MGKIKRKIKQLFANRGFYIILFSCLCIVVSSVVIRGMSNSVMKKMNTNLGEQSAQPSPSPIPDTDVQSVSTNVDIPPTGDIAGMFRTVLMFENPKKKDAEIIIRRKKLKNGAVVNEYEIIKSELADALGSLEDAGALILLRDYLKGLEEE